MIIIGVDFHPEFQQIASVHHQLYSAVGAAIVMESITH